MQNYKARAYVISMEFLAKIADALLKKLYSGGSEEGRLFSQATC